MKILLVVPPSSQEERYGSFQEAGAVYPSLGLAYIAASAERAGHTVKVIDAEACGLDFPAISARMLEFEPDVVGMQTFCATMGRCLEVAKLSRALRNAPKVVLGGVQATLFPEEALASDAIDFVVIGEGDLTFVELLEALQHNKPLSEVKGIVWKDEGVPRRNPPRALIQQLDSLPMPALHLFPMDRYQSASQLRGLRTMHLFTSRGCPFHCAYCNGDLIFGRTFRFHSAERVIAEIRRLRDEFGVDSIQFYDETFTVNRKRILLLCKRLLEERLAIEWACFTRVDMVDEDLLREMKRAGCYQIFFGVETGVPRLLEMIEKGTTLDQARFAFKLCRKVGIETLASFMLTLPTETEEESRQSIKFGLELDPDYVYWLTFTPYPGTRLTTIARQSGTILSTDFASYNVFNSIVYLPEGRSEDEIKRLLAKAYRRFYFRPRYLVRRLNSFRKLPASKVRNLIVGGLKTFIRQRV